MARARAQSKKTAAPVAAVSQTAPTSPSAEAVLGDLGAGSDDAASSNGASDTLDAGAGGDTIVGGDQGDSIGGGQGEDTLYSAGDDDIIEPADGQAVGDVSHADLSQEPSANPAPQVLDPASTDQAGDDAQATNEILLGSSVQPAIIELIPDVTVSLGEVVAMAAQDFAQSSDAWNVLSEAEREAFIAATIEILRGHAIDGAGLIRIEGRSRDDKPYRRAGIAWTSNFEPHLVTPEQFERIRADAHLIYRLLD